MNNNNKTTNTLYEEAALILAVIINSLGLQNCLLQFSDKSNGASA